MGYFGHGKQADHIEVKKDLHLSVVLCLFWHFFRKGSKRIDFRRIGIAVLHIFLLHGPLTPYACIFSFNADSLNWLPTNPEFRVGDLQYCLDRFGIQHCQHIALCFCTIALA